MTSCVCADRSVFGVLVRGIYVQHTCCINPTNSCMKKSYKKERDTIKNMHDTRRVRNYCALCVPLTISKSLLIRNRMRIRGDRGKFSS